jgi:hypothetical protein
MIKKIRKQILKRKDTKIKDLHEFTDRDIKTINNFVEFYDRVKSLKCFDEELQGFIVKQSVEIGAGAYASVYSKNDVIIKLSSSEKHLVPAKNTRIYPHYIPTISISINEKNRTDMWDYLVFQKPATARACPLQLESIRKKIGERAFDKYDMHEGNVGKYKNKTIIFDF